MAVHGSCGVLGAWALGRLGCKGSKHFRCGRYPHPLSPLFSSPRSRSTPVCSARLRLEHWRGMIRMREATARASAAWRGRAPGGTYSTAARSFVSTEGPHSRAARVVASSGFRAPIAGASWLWRRPAHRHRDPHHRLPVLW
ncbi:hypothetical protein C2845_PM02G17120 [Panicum miliaceum]|uniref:Uncharacterized protein n=1 Tax=Panicum miliaceum TaxID=4540 RepID=A0A3L6SCN4_PANMI|nr:hypothetical protein C2845_PM02G17120 [Panicum miliaceum]